MKKRRGLAARGPSRKPGHHATRAMFERCEDRLLLATTFTVTSLSDNPATVVAGDGTLRGEILAANANTMNLPNDIVFNVPGSGVQTINVQKALPAVAANTMIDGTTATNQGFNPAQPRPFIEISGKNVPGVGLTAAGAGVTFRDLIVDNFTGDGIDLNGSNDTVDGCWIGVDGTGGALASNVGYGVLVASSNNVVGDTLTNPNVISGNFDGIAVIGNPGQVTGNLIQHNYLGTDATGTFSSYMSGGLPTSLGNKIYGIDNEASTTQIGGSDTTGPLGLGNLVSGNILGGVFMTNQAGNAVVQGNYIGTDLTGVNPIPNGFLGVEVFNISNVTIGGLVPGEGNVISGNKGYGVEVSGATTANVSIQGNDIGVGAGGLIPVGNQSTGVFINSSSFVTVGGTTLNLTNPANANYANIIAYNGIGNLTAYGVEVFGGVSDGILTNSIFGNGGPGIKLTSGGNQGISPPILTSVETAGQTRITGTYSGIPRTQYRIQFFSNQVPNASGAGDGQTFIGEINITTDKLGNATFTTTLNQGIAVGTSVSATATQQPLQINNTSQFAQNVVATQAASTDLSVTTSPTSPLTPLLDQPFTFTITVNNLGPDPSTNVVLTDTIPTTSAFVSATVGGAQVGTFTNGVLTYDIGTMNPGDMVVLTLKVTPDSTTGTFTNTAVVQGDALDSNEANNTSTTTGSVSNSADLTALLTPSATVVPVGSPLTYVLVVGNNGPTTTNDTTETVSFPSDFVINSVQPDQGSYSIDGFNNVTIDTGILPPSSSSTIVFTVTPTVIGTNVAATATVSSSTNDPNMANNSSTATITVANAADLALAVSASPSPVLIGQDLIYTLTVTNLGPSTATSPVVTDTLPTSVIYDPNNSSIGAGGSLSPEVNGVVTAVLPQFLAAGSSYTFTIAVLPQVSSVINNVATVGDPDEVNPVEIDPNLANNTVTTATQVSPADVGVSVIAPSGPLFIGTQAVYQILVTNSGPATATNVTFIDTFGAGSTIVSASSGFVSGSTVTDNVGTLAPGASATVTIVVNPTASVTLVNSASVNADQLDPFPNNNTSSASNVVSPVDPGVTVIGTPDPTLIGHPITNIVTVTNSGPAVATNVIFTNTLPAGAILVSSSQGAVSASNATTLVGNLGSLAPGASATVTIVVTPTVIATAVDTASVTSDNVDTNPGNNTASGSVSVTNQPGTIQVGSALVLVPENAGFVTLTIDRLDGTLGTVTVAYATSDYTAIAGVNYTATSGTVTFLDGQTTATITIPVLDDLKVDGNLGFFVTLSSPTGGATLGAQNVAAVLVLNTDRDTIPPIVTGLIAIPNGSSINGFVITFDKAMDPGRASFVGNYHVFETNGSAQIPIALAAANYDPTSFSVTLVPTSPLPSNRFYHIIANGSYGLVLTDTSGNSLYGSAGVGSNYDVYYGQGTKLSYDDSQQNAVNINLTGGGTMSIFLASNGDAAAVNLYGIVPRKSKLTGGVKKLTKSASGETHIGEIVGFGQFGNVYSTLTTPPFYVTSDPVSVASVSATSVSALSIPNTSTVTTIVKKKTPKGPHALVN